MEHIGVISYVEEATEWYACMVVVVKNSGDLCIYVDPTQLNKSVSREKYILPSVEKTFISWHKNIQ